MPGSRKTDGLGPGGESKSRKELKAAAAGPIGARFASGGTLASSSGFSDAVNWQFVLPS
jgi:hypothetical protein